jgi:hypothetical protein
MFIFLFEFGDSCVQTVMHTDPVQDNRQIRIYAQIRNGAPNET